MNIKAEDAKRLLEDEIFQAVLARMEESIVSGMKRSLMGDLDTHHQFVLSLQLLENMKNILKTIASGESVKQFNTKMSQSVL